jgi:hypothetical protein
MPGSLIALRSLAWVEMRLILGCILWHFDLELDERGKNWGHDQRTWFIWDKPELPLRFLARSVSSLGELSQSIGTLAKGRRVAFLME